jgi:Family of unknown function (DUF5519)
MSKKPPRTPIPGPPCDTTGPESPSTGTPPTSSPPSSPAPAGRPTPAAFWCRQHPTAPSAPGTGSPSTAVDAASGSWSFCVKGTHPGHHGRVSDWTATIIDRCADLAHASIGEGAFGPGPAVWVGKREVAHLDDESTVDVRLTKSVIRARRSQLAADDRVRVRSAGSDWIEVRIAKSTDTDFAIALIRDAIEANLPTAPPGPPPTGSELERRRRFH